MLGGDPGQDVVARQQQAMLGTVEADVAGGVARRPDRPQPPTAQVDLLVVLDQDVGLGHGDHRLQHHRGEGQVGEHLVGHAGVGGEVEHGLEQGVGVAVARLQDDGIVRMEPDPGTGGLARPTGQAVAVRVDVRHEHGRHVRDASSGGGQARGERPPTPRPCPTPHRRWRRRPRRARAHRRARSGGDCRGWAQDRPQPGADLLHRWQNLVLPCLFLHGAGDHDHDRHGTRLVSHGG